MALPFLNAGLNFQTRERLKLEFPMDGYKRWKRKKFTDDVIYSMLEFHPAHDTAFLNKSKFVQEYIPNIH